MSLPSWVREAARLPLAFAQVREDPLLDRWVVERLPAGCRIALIASGGCTAALLATASVSRLHLVDPNPAQLALSRLKLRLLQTEPDTRLALLGHAPLPVAERRQRLAAELEDLGLAADALGPRELVAELGPDYSGRYERAFAALQLRLAEFAAELQAVLRLSDPAEQARRVAPQMPLGRRLDEALDDVLALPNLVHLFGEEATRNPVESFSRHFARRLRHVLATLPAERNPFLWQMLCGRYPDHARAAWFDAPPARLPEVTVAQRFMHEALAAEPAAFDLVHLSNILDWLTPEKATEVLTSAWQALRPGGYVFIRQLNSSLDIPRLGEMFAWLPDEADDLHARDTSFFYRALHLGRKR